MYNFSDFFITFINSYAHDIRAHIPRIGSQIVKLLLSSAWIEPRTPMCRPAIWNMGVVRAASSRTTDWRASPPKAAPRRVYTEGLVNDVA
jgi:hypothetical protein